MESTKTYYEQKLATAKERYFDALKEYAKAAEAAKKNVDTILTKNTSQDQEKPVVFAYSFDLAVETRKVVEAEANVRKYQEIVDALRWYTSEVQNA